MTLTALAVPALLAFLAASVPLPSQAQDPGAVVMATCTKCHNTKRICVKLGTFDKAAWEKTVTRMIGNGAKLSAQEKPAVVDWLAAQQPGAKPVCE